MADPVYIDFPHADVAAMQVQMQRFASAFGKDIVEEIKFATWAIASALSAATKVAPKTREIEQATEANTGEASRILAPLKSRSGKSRYDVYSLKGGKSKVFPIYHFSKMAAKRDKRAIIGMRGLAKSSWFFAQRKYGRGGGGAGGATGNAKRWGERLTETEEKLRGLEPHIKITNRVEYATQAFKSGGPQTVNNACERAHKQMAHILDGKIAKKLGVKLWK
jgi:hypothetical protein